MDYVLRAKDRQGRLILIGIAESCLFQVHKRADLYADSYLFQKVCNKSYPPLLLLVNFSRIYSNKLFEKCSGKSTSVMNRVDTLPQPAADLIEATIFQLAASAAGQKTPTELA